MQQTLFETDKDQTSPTSGVPLDAVVMPIIEVGDVVAIRGDLRNGRTGKYTPDQLYSGVYVKHAYNNSIWTGVVEKVDRKNNMALVGGGWRGFEHYCVMYRGKKR